jgi:DNA-directed RNA polymerase subunit RPC12/RpoP
MDRNVAALKFEFEADNAGSRCGACGEAFEKPLLAMVFSDSLMEEYYACPKCLSKVANLREKNVEVEEAAEVAGEAEEPAALKFEGSVGEAAVCIHYLGYLKKRPKNTPIPEECLTCSKMIDCMY